MLEHASSNASLRFNGIGKEFPGVKALAQIISEVVGYQGSVSFDVTKPDGTARKLMDSSRLFALGWRPQVILEQGIPLAYEDFLKRYGP